ncbi:MAG TPA: threonine synthase [Candidatus Borkfalkia excrementavium]|uniref:Threonine synthase n=1 Tax=Candidatus Borkfalkia excrementavium TaxID=2838505 RepID=A0A9D1Z7N3_9FIRM|nr:threonine synthase [Candidatus Borkfalkia excrementavium]
MNFISTRGGETVSGAQAIAQGIAKSGGLFVPEQFPEVSREELEEMLGMSYAERAAAVLHKYLDEYDYGELKSACEKAYAQFEEGDPAPLVKIDSSLYILELFHGPTCAFKDMALTLLPYLLRKGCDLTGVKEQVLILVATSGDTGKAALEGFKNAEGVKIMVFYPNDGVSKMQKLQMSTQEGDNVNVVAVRSNFDDCQTAVKTIFTSETCKEELKEKGYILSSANSINFGRLAPQIAYYFSAYLDLVSSDQISMGDKVNFAVPTGNFGNILAAYYAKRMGLPVGKLVCASNKNNILTDFIKTGVYDKRREFYKTMSPSMDILISSNLERLLFELSGRNTERTKLRMEKLAFDGVFEIYDEEKEALNELFAADFCGEDETVETIYEFFEEYQYPMDTHTACAMYAAGNYMAANKKDAAPMVVVSTASPYKFPQDVMYALTGNDIKDSFKAIKHMNIATAMKVPKSLSKLRDKPVRFTAVADKDKLYGEVLKFIDKK